LLSVINPNIRQGFDKFALFEINKAHLKQDGLNEEGVPIESDMISAVIADKDAQKGAPYYQAKYLFEYVIKKYGIDVEFKQMDSEIDSPIAAPFEYRRSAMVIDRKTGIFIGIIGEFKKSVSRYFKLPEFSAGFEINARALFEVCRKSENTYHPISKFPGSERDVCFKVSDSVNYDQILSTVKNSLENINLESSVQPVDIYQAEGTETKNITIKIKLVSHQKTMTSGEVNAITSRVIEDVISATGAIVV
jgi:phenylalanyl-tRNA synthetase beta chain